MAMAAPFCVAAAVLLLSTPRANAQTVPTLDERLRALLSEAGFTGAIEESFEDRLGRPIDLSLSDLGRRLWFDTVLSLHNDTTCASCHSPTNGFGDTQSIAIGVQSNMVVGADREGPRNRRRSPMTANAAFYPAQMWDGRFFAPSGDPFDNSYGFEFPEPEGTMTDSNITHLLSAQAFLPVTELHEMAGFTGTYGTLGTDFDPFDDGLGEAVPAPDVAGYRNEPIRQAILDRLNDNMAYRHMFASNFTLPRGASIEFWMVGAALAEFQFIQIAANAPLDKYVRDLDDSAMTTAEKRGALLFFGKAGCVSCHAVADEANEMFSDFQTHVIAVPQVIPQFGVALGNVIFDGTTQDEDYGLEETTGDPADRYKFRTAPLRNLARSPAFFHNGAFTDLEDAIRHHVTVVASATSYDPVAEGIDEDLTHILGPVRPMLEALDPWFATRLRLTDVEIANLVTFVRDALLDEDAVPGKQCAFIPEQDEILSGAPLEYFPDCPEGHQGTVPAP
jgi:cytochrome c peroxidase